MNRIHATLVLLLSGALVLAGCGLPGTSVSQSGAPTQVSEADLEGTIQARLEATAAAASEQSTSVPPDSATKPPLTEASSAIPEVPPSTVAPSSDAANPTAAATTAPEPSAVAQSGAATGPDAVIALGRSTLNLLGTEGWSQPLELEPNSVGDCGIPGAVFSADGDAFVACRSRIYRDAGGTWAEDEALSNNSQIFADPAGPVWLFGSSGALLIDGAQTTTITAQEAVGEEDFGVEYAAFAPDGTTYFVQPFSQENLLVSFDGTAWKGYGKDIGLPDAVRPTDLLVTAKGELLVGCDEGLYRLNGERFEEALGYQQIADDIGYSTSHRFTPGIKQLAQTPDGLIWFGTRDQGLFSWDGTKVAAYDRTSGLPSNGITDLAVDGAGRLWVATTYGLALRDGEGFTVAEPSTSELADSYIVSIAVKGAPELPAPAAEAKTAVVGGQITESKQPLPGATIGLCSERPVVGDAVRYGDEQPCANHRFAATATTDEQGNYRFEDVPLGTYSILIVDNTKGQQITPSGLLIPVLAAGEEVVQDLDYDG